MRLTDEQLNGIRQEVYNEMKRIMVNVRDRTYDIVVDDDKRVFKRYMDGTREYVGRV